jgi:hypothetical protein
MRRNLRMSLILSVALALGIGFAGCSSDAEKELNHAKEKIGEFAIRNAAAIAGSAAFKENGYPLEKRLVCTANVTSDNTATLACTGTTKDGKPVTLDGTADDDSAGKGSFVGKVDGHEVFSQDCLDCT